MKLKYYLRGLGIGIAVTTLILTIAHNINGSMSDAEIIKRAEELGMVMSTEEDSLFSKPDESTTEPGGEDGTDGDEQNTSSDNEKDGEETSSDEKDTTQEPSSSEDDTEPSVEVKSLTFTIESGMTSYAVSNILADGGIVSDSKEFNNFMKENGFTEKIDVGTFTVDSSMSYAEIAKIITVLE